MERISAVIVAKNEESNIKKCIESIRDLADEIIVVDNESDDKTYEIAKNLGVKVFKSSIKNDLAELKNFALSKASFPYILSIDADETISKKDHDKIKSLTNNGEYVAFSLIQRNYRNGFGFFSAVSCKDDEYDECVGDCYVPRKMVRFFKNHSKIRFTGEAHDSVLPQAKKIGKVLDTEIPIHHFGLLDEKRTREKTLRYLEIEKKNLRQDYFEYYQIASQLHSIGKKDEALDYLKESVKLNPNFSLSWLELGIIYIETGLIYEAEKVLKKAESLDEHAMIYSHLGIVYGILNKLDLSEQYFKKSIQINPKNPDTHFNLGLTLRKKGKLEKAKKHFQKALYLNPKYKEKVSKFF